MDCSINERKIDINELKTGQKIQNCQNYLKILNKNACFCRKMVVDNLVILLFYQGY